MGTKYSSQTVSGYNATPPVDDGTISEANKVKWSTFKTKLGDPLNTFASNVNSALTTHFNNGPTALTTNTTLGATHYNQVIQISGSGNTLTLSDAATLGSGWFTEVMSTDTNSVTLARATGGDTIDGTAASVTIIGGRRVFIVVNAAANGFLTRVAQTIANGSPILPGFIQPYAGSAAPNAEWLLCDGSAVSRTTYASLFAVTSTTFGTGDGATTFNVPDLRSRSIVGVGTGTLAASGANADVDTSADTLTVTSNNSTWITGMSVVFTLASGTITGLTSGNTYFVIRSSSTLVKLASSLANAVAGTAIDLTAKSSPVWTITQTLTARALGEKLGEETHATVIAEQPVHTHTSATISATVATNTGTGSGTAKVASNDGGGSNNNISGAATDTPGPTGSSGSSTAHNNMQPGLALNYIIKT